MRWARAAFAAAVALVLLQLAGLVDLTPLAIAEQRALFVVMQGAWLLDEARRAVPLPLGLVLAAGVVAALVALVRRPGGTRTVAGVILGPPAALFLGLCWALEPEWLLLLAISAWALPTAGEQRPAGALPTVLCASVVPWMASLGATHSEGTAFDRVVLHAPHAPWVWVVAGGAALGLVRTQGSRAALVTGVAAAVAGVSLGLRIGWIGGLAAAGGTALAVALLGRWRARGGAVLPDPLGAPSAWPQSLAPWVAVGWGLFLFNATVEMSSCGDVDRAGVTVLAEERAAFDLASDGATLAVVYREARTVVLRSLATNGGELTRVRVDGGEPEEVIALPSTGDYLVTVVRAEPDASGAESELLRVGPSGQRRVRADGLCGLASMAWDPDDRSVLLGCENEPWVHRYRPDVDSVSAPLPSGVTQGLEDLAVTDDAVYVVPLVMGHELQELDRATLALRRVRGLGGFAYEVGLDVPRGQLLVSRFVGGALSAIDLGTLERTGRARLGFGARPVEVLADRGLIASASMMHTGPWLLDAATLRGKRLDLGGLSKGLASHPDGRTLYASTTCGLLALDLDTVTP